MSAEVLNITDHPKRKSFRKAELGEIPSIVASHLIICLYRYYLHESGYDSWKRQAEVESGKERPANMVSLEERRHQQPDPSKIIYFRTPKKSS